MNTMGQNELTISQNSLEYIYSIFGFPAIDLEDIGILDEESIKRFVIVPALRQYYKYFPMETKQTVVAGAGGIQGTLDFPSPNVFGVTNVQLAKGQDSYMYSGSAGEDGSGIFFRSRTISKNSAGSGMGSRYDYGSKSIQATKQASLDAESNIYNMFFWDIDWNNKQLNYRTVLSGKIEITWALWNSDFDSVRFEHYDQLIKLCQGQLLMYWSRLLNKVDPETPTAFDVDSLRDEGQELIEEVTESWKNTMKPVLIRTAM